jgi:thiamine-monophosphate kinase
MPTEQRILETIARILPDAGILSDDTYLDGNRILTIDTMVEGQHFDWAYFSPEDLGWKVGAVNISDIAATGGTPTQLLVALALPESATLDQVEGFYRGLQSLAERYGAHIVGGDTVRSPLWVVTVTAIGEIPAGHTAGHRAHARPGDIVLTTGPSGLSAMGLALLSGQRLPTEIPDAHACHEAHLRPIPRVEAGLLLSRLCPRYAVMDTSDGLADAALKVAKASQVQVQLCLPEIPVHPALQTLSALEQRQLMLYGGEDFELFATVPAPVPPALLSCFQPIGRVVEGHGAVLIDSQGAVLETLTMDRTFQHFTECAQPSH